MDSLTISRVIFLLFIVVLSVYFLFLNKSLSSRSEHFTADATVATSKPATEAKPTTYEIVLSTYQSEYKRVPTSQEMDFWTAYTIEKKPTNDELIKTIKSSSEILAQSYTQSANATKPAYGTEDEVTDIYNTILNRLPNDLELFQYSKMLKEDKTFTEEKLKQILYASTEYRRLEKTQSNQVYSNTIGGVTDRQLTFIVMTIYKEVVGKDKIDPDELHFLKKKFIDFNLDEAIFKKFLENYIKNQPFNQQLAASQKINDITKQSQEQDKQEQKEKTDAAQYDQMKKELYSQLSQDIKNQSLLAEKQGYSDQQGTEQQTVTCRIQANKTVTDNLTAKQNQNDNYLDSSNVIDTIKHQATCVFDKNNLEKKYTEDQQTMAALINQRNRENMKDTCVRNKMYLGADEDLVLDPSLRWKLPEKRPPVCTGSKNDYQPTVDQTALIGTLLQDAKQTKVGDVVSPLPPK
jgi:hypothetical protein